jgi:RNA polymerase sigma factor (sigma-70 family)
MQETNDMDLLRDYSRQGSEAAFAELVQRHINLVYSVALRHAGITAHAEEITQAVFIILARKAAGLRRDTILEGWLYETTRLTALSFLRSERRRRFREQEAYMQSRLNEPDPRDAVWSQLAPLLDEAMARLGKTDRDAVVLRFFNDKGVREVANALQVSEAAAQRRILRALEKLHRFFNRHGISSTTAIVAGAISANSVQAAPAALAKSVTAVALAKGAAASTSTLTLIKGALKIMAWTKTKTAVVGVAAAFLGIGGIALVVDRSLPSPDIQGTWIATELLGGWGVQAHESPRTRLVLKIARVNGNYQATGDDIDRGYKNVSLDVFTYKHRHIHAEVSAVPDSFDGTVNLAGTKISGRWTEGKGGSGSLVFTRTANPPAFPEPLADAEFAPRAGSDLQGLWQGWIGSGTGMIHFEIKIADASDGTFRADFYCPDRKAVRQPTTVSYDGTTVNLITMAGYGMFQGTLSAGGRGMTGDWIQDGRHTPTTLARAN